MADVASSGPAITGYAYRDAGQGWAHPYLLPTVAKVLDRVNVSPRRAFDLGCGNGAVAAWLTHRGFEVTGVDPSASGIQQAKTAYPHISLHAGSCYDPLGEQYGTFPLVVSLEVVEHVYAPRTYAKCVHDLLQDGGYALISTPYHGYWKNLALAVTGQMDRHFTALWDHGHIKFWSRATLTRLLEEAGLMVERIYRVGRVPPLAKSMLVVARKIARPAQSAVARG